MLVTFTLEKKNCKRAWKYPLETLPTTVCIDFSFEISDALGQSTICSPRFCSFEIHRQIHTSLFVGLHNLFDSNIRIGCLDFILSCCSLFFFLLFLVSVVVGILYKDLHEVLITDQPNRTITGTTRWGYLLKFLNQMPPQSKIHKRLNL